MNAEKIIELENIVKIYKLGKIEVAALKGITLTISRGEFVAIMGPSGSGKSTLMNIIGCLDTPTSGNYYLHGQLVSDLSDDKLAHIRNREIGFVFQTFNLLPRYTSLENIALPLVYAGIRKKEREARALAMLELVDLLEWKDHRPNELSGGQRQKIAIARALINSPSIIIADEPTGNLDSESAEDVMQLFQKIHAQGNTILLVTHNEEIALYAKRLIRIKDGQILSDLSVEKTKLHQE